MALLLFFPAYPLIASPWVWKAQKGNEQIVIVGVIHYGPSDSGPKSETLDYCLGMFSTVDRVYFETLPADWEANGVRSYISRKGGLGLGKNLTDVLPKASVVSMQPVIRQSPELGGQIGRLRPWNAATVIYRHRMARVGFTNESSLERQFYRSLFAQRMKMKGLESPYDQLKALSELPEDAEIKLFDSAVISDKKFSESVNSLFAAWKKGDLKTMRATLKASPFNVAEMDATLLEERNRKWARSLVKIQRSQKNIGLVVGIEHLVRENGALLEQLSKLGYEITRLK